MALPFHFANDEVLDGVELETVHVYLDEQSSGGPTGLFAQNEDTTTGLTLGYNAGITRLDATVTVVAAGTILLTASQANVYVEVNVAGVISMNTTGFSVDKKPMFRCTTDGGSITVVDDKRVAFDFSIPVHALTAETTINDADTLPIYDASAGGHRKITRLNLFSGILGVMSALGDIIYGGAAGVYTRLAGNTTTTKRYFTQTGDGAASAAPGWNVIAAADLPTGIDAAKISAGTVSNAEFDFINGVTSAIQTQLDTMIDGALTAGRVPFAADADTLTDDAQMVFDGTNNWLGVGDLGLEALAAAFHASGTGQMVVLDRYNNTGSSGVSINARRALGTPGVPLPLTADVMLFRILCNGFYDGAPDAFTTAGLAQIRSYTAQVWTNTAQGTYWEIWVTANGATAAVRALRVENDRSVLFDGQIYSESFALTDGATIAVDWNNGNKQWVTLGGNRTFTFANPKDGASYTLLLIQDAGAPRTITWPTVTWTNADVAPTLSTAVGRADAISLWYVNGVYYGALAASYGA